MKIHLVTAEHFRDGGLIQKAFTGDGDAEQAAADLVTIMLKDTRAADGPSDFNTIAFTDTWRIELERLQDYHGAAHCYVEITEIEVAGSAPSTTYDAMRYRLAEAVNEWPQYDVDDTLLAPGCIPDDEVGPEVNGGDLVEWFGEWRGRVKELLSATV